MKTTRVGANPARKTNAAQSPKIPDSTVREFRTELLKSLQELESTVCEIRTFQEILRTAMLQWTKEGEVSAEELNRRDFGIYRLQNRLSDAMRGHIASMHKAALAIREV